MGKPYANELEALDDTYSWALAAPVHELARWFRSAAGLPLIAVGSGGSFTSAVYASFVHGLFTGRVAKAVTPLDATVSPLHFADLAFLLLSAGGGNPDIIACVERAGRNPPSRFGVFCTRKGSPLAEAVSGSAKLSLHEYELPTGKDGFLATNSLLATAVLLTRAYAEAWGATAGLPATLAELVHPGSVQATFRGELCARCQPLWERETTVVLHGAASHAAAVDVESKFTEAAIGHVQTADYRNFAHGRHYWLARYPKSTAVLALVTPEDRALATRTLRLLPTASPSRAWTSLTTPSTALLPGLVIAMRVAARRYSAGRRPRPSVGPHIRPAALPPRRAARPPMPETDLSPGDAAAIEGKQGSAW